MPAPYLPVEIIDMILESLFYCPQHPWSSTKRPCANLHKPSHLPRLLPLRLVNRSFHDRLTPILFNRLSCTGYYRSELLMKLSRHKLVKHVRHLNIEIAPADVGNQMKRVIAALIPVDKKLLNYFEALRIFISPILKRFRRVRELQITTTYKGIYERHIPKNKLIGRALEELCRAVKAGDLKDLEELILGVPYEGGFASSFADLDDERYSKLMRGTARQIQTGTVKLYDRDGKFTTISYF